MPVSAATAFDPSAPPQTEFARQVDTYERLGYPALLEQTPDRFRAAVEPLAQRLDELPAATAMDPDDHLPFVLVLTHAPPAAAARLMTLNDKPAALMLADDELATFVPTADVDEPAASAYLLVDIDTGSEFANVPPEDARPTIMARGRSPLTVTEGIAIVTLRPDMLRKNRCFSLLGSRCGDRRVPAIWISQRAPKLGWCWDGAPHTWLGSASAGGRAS